MFLVLRMSQPPAVRDFGEEAVDRVHADAGPCHRGHGFQTQLLPEHADLEPAVPLLELVPHVEGQHRGQTEVERGLDEHEVRLETCGVDDQEDGVRGPDPFGLAVQHVPGHLLVERPCAEAVDPGQVDDLDLAPVGKLAGADPPLDGDARVVRDLLAEAGQAVEERRLPGVRRSDQGDERDVAVGGGTLKGGVGRRGYGRHASLGSGGRRLGGELDAEAVGHAPSQREHAPVDHHDGITGRGVAHRAEMTAGHDAELEERNHLLLRQVDAHELHDLVEIDVDQTQIRRLGAVALYDR